LTQRLFLTILARVHYAMIPDKHRTPIFRARSRALACLVASVGLLSLAGPALAWVYPEHRDIAVLAAQGLDPERRAAFERLWQQARVGDEQRLCLSGADAEQGLAPSCIDWAALSAIAGDHSCSSQEMLETVRRADWILVVAGVAAQLKVDLAKIPVTALPEQLEDQENVLADTLRALASEANQAARVNALRTADTRLQRADPAYATRAAANNAHFLLARPRPETDERAYADLTVRPGSELNALGVYAWYHLSALQKATRLARERLTPAEYRALARAMLFDEAFALHFLEDVFAAGHVAGVWGNASQRKGTHDFYNQHGLEVFTWEGSRTSVVLMGDAHMRPADAERAANSARTSLEQVLDVASGRSRGYELPYTPAAPAAPDSFDVCRNDRLPQREASLGAAPEYRFAFEETLRPTPVPGLGSGLGSMPRFRSEVGLFIGLAGSIEGRSVSGGFEASQDSAGVMGGLDLSLRIGFGLEGVMGDSGDGLVFGSIGFRADTPSSNQFSDTTRGQSSGNLSAAIPARTALSTRIRMPFYLIPGDLLFLAPLYLIAPTTYTQMAVTASNGGLIPWQLGWATPIGRFQFVLGRELGVNFYGLTGKQQLLAPSAEPGGLGRVIDFKSIAYDIPIVEYRVYRAFSTDQSSSVQFQLFGTVDVPYGSSVASPAGAPDADLRPVWSLGLRMTFDWRYYR
jgi:hypothetical protein